MRPHIVYGTRSEREGKPWQCSRCKTQNDCVRKLIFNIPRFSCANCGKSFFDDNVLDFSLADVEINGQQLIDKIFNQERAQCMANAICQSLRMMYKLDCILKKKQPEARVLNLQPCNLFLWYDRQYPVRARGAGSEDSNHKFIKMLLKLRREGIELEDGTYYKIGDISSIPMNNYEAICEQLADGVPLLTSFVPGCNFRDLGYCLIYRPPSLKDANECWTWRHNHNSHTVLLIGVCSNGEQKGFYFVNSWGLWCPRFMLEKDGTVAVHYGVAKLAESGLIDNAIKLWPLGESARLPYRFVDEPEDRDHMNYNLPANLRRLNKL